MSEATCASTLALATRVGPGALRFQIYSLDFWASCSSPSNVESWQEA